ncbi:hypothetical protein EPO33_02375 [Patescibacteria group bacterium]|nr:MAG: hypothetical protein EPO33_02375 [Patescibacteria group bacterium]
MKKIAAANTAITGIGTANAGYALWQHYAPAGSAFCNLSATFSCDIVNKSPFSEFMGVPVALIGIVGNIALLAAGLWLLRHPRNAAVLYLALALGALGFSLYLTGIEFFLLGAFCIVCLFSQGMTLTIAALAVLAWRKSRTPAPVAA